MAAAVILAGAAWMGLSGEAQAQALITPTGPLSLRAASPTVLELKSDGSKVYPGRTMGGGTRILRTNPPPSSLKRRKE
jgi:hypothetical protein